VTTEIFITMAAVPCREPSELERNLEAAHRLLANPLRLSRPEDLEDELAVLTARLGSLEDAFVPASLSEEEAAPLLADLVDVKGRLRTRLTEVRELMERLAQCSEEMSGLSLWMKEVKVFLGAEEAAYGELETLEAQLRESNALQASCSYCSWFEAFLVLPYPLCGRKNCGILKGNSLASP
jgi:DNA repair exonuclease SbcCD ATPase subunit